MIKKRLRAIYPIDYFRVTPSLNFKKSSHFSCCGSMLSGLMYALLVVFFIWQIVLMATRPITTSGIQYGQYNDTLDLSEIKFCQSFNTPYDKKFAWTDDISFYFTNKTYLLGSEIPRTLIAECPDNKDCLCFSNISVTAPGDGFQGLVVVLHTSAQIQRLDEFRDHWTPTHPHSDVIHSELQYTMNFPVYWFDPDNIQNPLQKEEQALILNTAAGSVSKYHFEKVVYEAVDGIVWNSKKIYQTMSLTYIDKIPAIFEGYDMFFLLFDGQVVTNSRSFKKLPDVFSAVVGVKEAFILIVTILFGQYFNFKYFENLINNLTRSKKNEKEQIIVEIIPESKQPIQRNSEDEKENSSEDQEIQFTYLTFIIQKIRRFLRVNKREVKYEERKMLEIYEKERDAIESQLDVVNLLQDLKKLGELKAQNKILMERLSKLEEMIDVKK